MDTILTFFVPGIPKAMQTGSVVRLPNGRAIPLRRNTAWGTYVGLIAQQHAPKAPLEGALIVYVTAWFPRPKSRRIGLHTVRPDAENLLKALDQLNGLMWRDDAQIVSLHVEKHYAGEKTPPGMKISIQNISIEEVGT